MAIRTLARKTNTGSGTLQLIQQPIDDHTFRVDAVLIKIRAVIKNSNAAPQTLSGITVGHNWKLKYEYADGMKWYDTVPLVAVERIFEQTTRNYLCNPVEYAKSTAASGTAGAYSAIGDVSRSFQKEVRDRAITAVGNGTQNVDFRFMLPLARPNASKPVDYSQALSLLGKLDIQLTNDVQSGGSTDLTVDSFTVEAIAIGERVDNFYAGIRTRHFVQGAQLNVIDDVIGFSGDRLLAHHMYATSGSIAGVDLVAKLDGKHTIVELNNGTVVTELNKLTGIVPGDFPADSERSFSDAVLVVAEPFKYSILDRPISRGLNLHWSSNSGTSGTQFHVVTVASPKGEQCRAAVYPGAGNLTPAGLDRVTRVSARMPSIDPNVLKNLRAWLPEEVFTPEATGSAPCGA